MAKPSCRIIVGDALTELRKLPSESVHCCVTSPPYWQLRDYGVDGQMGLEDTPTEYVAGMVKVFREVRRVLRSDGTLWLNLGDTYVSKWPSFRLNSTDPKPRQRRGGNWRISQFGNRLKEKDLAGIPWRVAFALQADGWYLRSDIIWHKPNPLPESVKDRPTRAHEYVFLLTKSPRYYYDVDSIREPGKPDSMRKRLAPWYGPRFQGHPSGRAQNLRPKQAIHSLGRNRRTVWTIPIRGYSGNHFATFPKQLVEPCIKAGSAIAGTVLDPFAGVGTTINVALGLSRRAIGIEINPSYTQTFLHERRKAV